MACGISVPWPGIEPRPSALGAWSLIHCATWEVPWYLFITCDLGILCTGPLHFIALCLIALCRYCIFYRLRVCGNPVSSKSLCSIFPIAFAHFVSVSYFGNSHNISNFFIIISVMVISDLWCYCYKKITTYCRLRWWLAFFSHKAF